MAVHVLLNEVGAPVTLKNVAGPPRPAEYLALNPRGSVPTLVEDNFVLREGAAVLITVAEKHNSPLLPASGRERARALEWLAFANATMHPAYARAFFMHRHLGDEAKNNPLYDHVVAAIQGLWNDVENTLQTQDYVCGKSCTLADILLTVIANWSPNIQKPITFGPKTKGLFQRVTARPAYQQALKEENVTYKVAA
jgi:glutathione S-transferase